jgi:two-component system sensor histidine kinase LytS
MEIFNMSLWLHWLELVVLLLPRLFVTIIAGLILLRIKGFRRILQTKKSKRRHLVLLIAVFGLFALIGTHWAASIDIHKKWSLSPDFYYPLNPSLALVGFRDTWTLVAGLVGGLWVGLGTGLIVGIDRYMIGGVAGLPSGFGTVVLGIFAGFVKQYRPEWTSTAWRVLVAALIGSIIQRLVLLCLIEPIDDAISLAGKIGVPVSIVNISGCVLFFWIMQDLERDQLANDRRKAGLEILQVQNQAEEARLEALQARVESERKNQLNQQLELRALRAQIEPHELNHYLLLKFRSWFFYLKALIYNEKGVLKGYNIG